MTTMPVSREEVLWAYRMILGREPENEKVLEEQADVTTLAALRDKFMQSAEFAEANPFVKVGMHLNRHSDPVEIDCTPTQLQAMLDRIAKAWTAFGDDDPYWSVLTHDAYRRESIEPLIDQFYASGRANVETACAMLERNGIEPEKLKRVIDFGCGVGRISLALAEVFEQVTGIDVSEPHLAIARAESKKRRVGNADFTRIRSIDGLNNVAPCDLMLSFIVLQHNPPPVIAATLERLLRRVSPGGAAMFQVPTFIRDYSFDPQAYLAGEAPQMEMNALPQRHVFRIAAEAGFSPLEVREDLMAAHPNVVSQTFLFRRNA